MFRNMTMPQSAQGSFRFIVAICLYGLAWFPLSETAAVPPVTSQRRAEVPPSVFEVPAGTRNLFPAANFNRDVTTNWWDTKVLDGHDAEAASELAVSLKNASFIVLDQEFYQLLENDEGNISAAVDKIFQFPPGPSFAQRIVHDGTVYSNECSCIFFAELHPPQKGFSADAMPWVWRVNLNETTSTTEKVYPSPSLRMANGAYYHNGSVYWAQEGNHTTPGGIVRMDPVTLQTEVVLNNFMGHRFNSPNDVVVTHGGVAYFTDGYYGFENFNDTLKPELANGLWRWDMRTSGLRMVAGAAGGPFTNPNGVALNLAEDRIYVTNRGNATDNPAGGRTIYEFELHDEGSGVPVRGGDVFAYADAGFPDGVKLDRDGRVSSTGIQIDHFASHGIPLSQLQAVPAAQRVQFRQGDVLLVRTGWLPAYNALSEEQKAALPHRPARSSCGVEASEDTTRWHWDKAFAAVASDTVAYEAWPSPRSWGVSMHEVFLSGWGMPIGESFDLEGLAAKCREAQRWSFMFVSMPLDIPGGVASPPGAMAIF
ncbi:hypothetical protein SLS63_013060 [Diaporthe eres]|uniref:SMP-30/Gluconolactonase/LRE-like region domain-containing protein n=1 Tax=Diaporthe eres TaxID=83184 RepID=A0ABR1NPK7_DIAER